MEDLSAASGAGFEYCFNAQAVLAVDNLLVVAMDVAQVSNAKHHIEPMLEQIDVLPAALDQVKKIVG